MPEDNVIRPVFGGRKKESVETRDTSLELVSSRNETIDLERDVEYFLSDIERVWAAHLQGDEMTNYLFDDVGYNKNDSSLELRRPVVQSYTLEQFCDRLLGSSRKEWRAQPAFYGAAFIEFHARQNLVLDALKECPEKVKELPLNQAKIIRDIAVRRMLAEV